MDAAILLKFTVFWILCSELVAVDILQYEDGISGQITSPGYPGNYPNNVNYTWIIRTGSRSANVTFRIIEMNIKECSPCDDYLEITEIKPLYNLFNRCGHFKYLTLSGRGEKIRISFISDNSMTERGFNLTWRVYLPPTKALLETRVTTQKMLSQTTKNKISTISKKRGVKTTFQQMTTTPISSLQVISTMPINFTSAPRTTESTSRDKIYPLPTKASPEVHVKLQMIILPKTTTNKTGTTSQIKNAKTNTFQHNTTYSASSQANSTEQATVTSPSITTSRIGDTTSYKHISTLSSITLIQESSTDVENSGRISISHIPPSSVLRRTTLQNRLRALTLVETISSLGVELTTFGSNTTTQKEDKKAFNIITG